MKRFINLEVAKQKLSQYAEDYIIVFAGTHDRYPETTEDFVNQALTGVPYRWIDVPGDGEPGLYIPANTDADVEGEILVQWEYWLENGICNPDMVVPDVDRYGSLTVEIQEGFMVAYFVIDGDDPMEEDIDEE